MRGILHAPLWPLCRDGVAFLPLGLPFSWGLYPMCLVDRSLQNPNELLTTFQLHELFPQFLIHDEFSWWQPNCGSRLESPRQLDRCLGPCCRPGLVLACLKVRHDTTVHQCEIGLAGIVGCFELDRLSKEAL